MIPGPVSEEMAWGAVYELALEVAKRHGATVPDAARDVGRYDFMQEVTKSADGLRLEWNEPRP